jgi:K+ transporter
LAIDVPFVAAAGFASVMLAWRLGRGLQAEHFADNAHSVESFLASLPAHAGRRIDGVCVVRASLSRGEPAVLDVLAARLHVPHELVILLTVVNERAPHVPDDERLEVKACGPRALPRGAPPRLHGSTGRAARSGPRALRGRSLLLAAEQVTEA